MSRFLRRAAGIWGLPVILVMVAAMAAATTAAAAPTRSAERSPALRASAHGGARERFAPTLGVTRSQVEKLFRSIDGRNTVFGASSKVKGVPRVLGSDHRLFTLVEINGYPEVVDVQVLSLLDGTSKQMIESQVVYDTLACAGFGGAPAERWCMGRVLNTNKDGLVTTSASKAFGAAKITVKTYQAKTRSNPPLVSIDIAPI